MNVVIAYDVSEDDRRARLAALLGTVGVRLQKSVFECIADAATLDEILARAESLLDLEHDSLMVFPACDPCLRGRRHLGQVNRTLGQLFWIV